MNTNHNSSSYILRVLIAVDQLVNVLFLNGSPDHTISGRVGYKAMTTSKARWLWAEKFINTLFFFEPNHCRRVIERDEIRK